MELGWKEEVNLGEVIPNNKVIGPTHNVMEMTKQTIIHIRY